MTDEPGGWIRLAIESGDQNNFGFGFFKIFVPSKHTRKLKAAGRPSPPQRSEACPIDISEKGHAATSARRWRVVGLGPVANAPAIARATVDASPPQLLASPSVRTGRPARKQGVGPSPISLFKLEFLSARIIFAPESKMYFVLFFPHFGSEAIFVTGLVVMTIVVVRRII